MQLDAPSPRPTRPLSWCSLRKPETFGVLDHHDGGVRHVDTDFDHSGCDEKAGLTGFEGAHGLVLFIRLIRP
jgi:hypothetical protein